MRDMNTLHNRAVWFDIPVADLNRALAFYRATLGIEVSREEFNGGAIGVLEHEQGNGGCLIPNKSDITSAGILLYMNVENRIRDAVVQAEKHGGKVLEPIHPIGPHGFRAIVLDSEGNRIALHSTVNA